MKQLTDLHVRAIAASGDATTMKHDEATTALADLYSFARRRAAAKVVEKDLSPDDVDDLASAAVAESATAVLSGKCHTGPQLSKMISRTIRRLARSTAAYGNAQLDPYGEAAHDWFGPIDDAEDALDMAHDDDLRQWKAAHDNELELRGLYAAAHSPDAVDTLRSDFVVVNSEVIRYLSKHPEQLHTVSPTTFERVVAEILSDLGYEVELTTRGADGGVDIIATQKAPIGEVLCLVDCKRYAPNRPVGVGIVRALYGIGEQQRASMALLATTSFFTKPAVEFQRAVRHQLSLMDYHRLTDLLKSYGTTP